MDTVREHHKDRNKMTVLKGLTQLRNCKTACIHTIKVMKYIYACISAFMHIFYHGTIMTLQIQFETTPQ